MDSVCTWFANRAKMLNADNLYVVKLLLDKNNQIDWDDEHPKGKKPAMWFGFQRMFKDSCVDCPVFRFNSMLHGNAIIFEYDFISKDETEALNRFKREYRIPINQIEKYSDMLNSIAAQLMLKSANGVDIYLNRELLFKKNSEYEIQIEMDMAI